MHVRHGASDCLHLVSRPQVGRFDVFGLAAGPSGLTDFPVLRASRRFVDCFGSADVRGMNANRVIKSNVEFFNTGTWAGSIWHRNTISAHGDNILAAMGSSFVQKYLAGRELPQTH